MPLIESAGWTDAAHGDNFYAILKDGSPYTILDNLGLPTEPPLAPIAFSPTRATKIVPASTQARLLFSLGDAFNNNVPVLQSLLTPAGYKTATGTGHLEELTTQIQGDGYFYWMTHSGWLTDKGVQLPIIATSDLYTKLAHDSNFIRDLYDQGMLTVTSVTNNKRAIPVDLNSDGKITVEEELDYNLVYAIRPAFIKKYFKFAANSVIMQESCTSADPAFRDAYIFAKAGAYVGWSSVTRPGRSMPILTDRLLGGNVLKPLDTPPERPFDIVGVMAWMQAKGYDLDEEGDSQLRAGIASGSNAGILAPSIQSMQINELYLIGKPSLLVISGIFGPRDDTKYKREVLVNGIPLKIVDGNDTSITAEIPETGNASAGPVVVVIGGRISNEVPISLYTLKMNYTFLSAGTMKVVDTITYKIRLDVHQNRGTIDTDPSGDVAFFFGRSDSIASFIASGTGVIDGCTHTWAGSGTITTAILGNPFTINLTGEYDRATGKFPSFQPLVLFKETDGTLTVQCPPAPPTTSPGGILNPVAYDEEPKVEIDLDTYAIQPGSVNYTTNPIGTGTLSWQLCAPQYPPTDKTKA